MDLLDGADLCAVDVCDHVSLLEPAGLGRGGGALSCGDVRQAHHQHALGKEFDPHRLSQRDDAALLSGGARFRAFASYPIQKNGGDLLQSTKEHQGGAALAHLFRTARVVSSWLLSSLRT